jgi:methionine sulfoxide reductase heme-binding subunit
VSARKKGNPWLMAIAAAAILVITAVLLLVGQPDSAGRVVVLAAALLGYQTLFLSIVSSAYVRQMLRWFGRPFLRVHHLAAIAGLALITLHPIAVSVEFASGRYWLPQFGSLHQFFQYGGAVAFYLFVLAALIAVYRKAFGSRWLALHAATYLAFLFATVHAVLIGEDFSSPVMKVVAAAMIVVVALVAVRRYQGRRRPAAKKAQ